MSHASANSNTTQVAARQTGKAPAKTGRTYQRGLSKPRTNVSRYTASGSTHRNGTTATSWQSLFVVASSSTDAHAASASHRSRRPNRGAVSSPADGAASSGTAGTGPLGRAASHAHAAHARENAPSPTDHTVACARRVSSGSTRNGYDTSASSDPAFESAYRRYGLRPGFTRLNHACVSGPVVDSTKYGSPIVTASSARICRVGASASWACQRDDGTIGSSASAASSSTPWRTACHRAWR